MPEIARFAAPRLGISGFTNLIRLPNLPAILLSYSAGVSALAAGDYERAFRVLREPRAQEPDQRCFRAVAEAHGLAEWFGSKGVAETMDWLADVIGGPLAIGHQAYAAAWEEFEILRLAEFCDLDAMPQFERELADWLKASEQVEWGLVDEKAIEDAARAGHIAMQCSASGRPPAPSRTSG